MGLHDELESDAVGLAPTSEELQQLSEAVMRLQGRRDELAELEEAMKEKKREVIELEMEVIPSIMDEVGLAKVETTEGFTVTIKDIISATVPKAKLAEAIAWLESEGVGDVVKAELKATFGRGDVDQARSLVERLRDEEGVATELREFIHPQTLQALVRERLREGKSLPPESIMNIFTGRKADVKQTK